MAVTAVAEITVDAPLEVAFARFIDFSSWGMWMPLGFRPVSGPARALREADRMSVGLGRSGKLVTKLTVLRVRPNKEICWRGGVPGVLSGEHSFFFADAGGKTRIRSEEPFAGLLTLGPLAKRLERDATELAHRQLASFATHVAQRH